VQGVHALELSITTAPAGKNAGIGQGGLGVVGGRSYTLSVHVRRGDGPAPSLMAALLDTSVQPIAVLAGPTPLPLDSPAGAWAAPSVRLVPTRSCSTASIAFVVQGASVLRFDAASLRPDDASAGVWPELVDAFRAAGVSVVRMGGIAADGYDWGDGIGPRDHRPARRSAYVGTTLDDANLMVAMPYYNDVGTDEFLDFCRAIGADALLTVSFPLGAVAAANWVQYVNGSSPGAAVASAAGWTTGSWRSTDVAPPGYFAWLREVNGHAAPWGVRDFEIGNELWDEELPEPGSVKGPQNLENYAAGVRQFAQAMKAVDPTIRVVANGRPEPVGYATGYRAGWTTRVLEVAGDVIDAIAPHFYGPGDFDAAAMGPEGSFYRVAGIGPTWESELAATQQAIDTRKATGNAGDIRIALTEYNIWQGVLQFKDDGAVNGMTGLLGMATFRNANLRGPVWMANAYDLVGLPFGMVRWEAADKAAGAPLHMGGWLLQRFYAQNALPVVHPATVQAPTYFVLAGAYMVSNAPVLDVAATSDEAGDRLSLLVVNRAYGTPDGVPTRLGLGGFVAASGTAHVLSGSSLDARVTFEDPGAIAVVDEPVTVGGAFLDYTFRPGSVTALDLHR